MNFRLTGYLLGLLTLICGAVMVIPLIAALIFSEQTVFQYLLSIGILTVVGTVLVLQKPKDTSMRANGGFVTVALSWIAMSLAGCLPFILTGQIPSFVDAFFESVSGFTTTGSSILSNVEALPKSLLLWRSLCQWLGGMGILVLVIAFLPQKTEGKIYYVFKAETPGPQKGKLVSRLSLTARILYLIYIGMTLLLVIFLLFGGLPFFDCLVLAFSSTATGGFSSMNASIAAYDSLYVETVVTVFCLLCSINFTLHYYILIGKAKDALKSEELRWFVGILMTATVLVAVSLFTNQIYQSIWTCLRYSFFQCTTVMSTTGFAFADTSNWTAFAQLTLLLLFFVGGCAGSTSGGLKVSRIMMLGKSASRILKSGLNSNRLVNVKLDGKIVDKDIVHNTFRYLMLYTGILLLSTMLITAVDSNFLGMEMLSNAFSAVASCLNNVGPGLFGLASGDMSKFSDFSKMVLSLNMLLGRLELLPICLIFMPKAWRK